MGSKRKGITDRINEGKEISEQAVESGEKLQEDGSEIKSILDSIHVQDEDDQSSLENAEDGYDEDFRAEFSESVDPLAEQTEQVEQSAADEANEAREENEDAEAKLREAAGVTDVGRGNADSAAEKMREGAEEYAEQAETAEDVIETTQSKIDSLRSSVDSIFG